MKVPETSAMTRPLPKRGEILELFERKVSKIGKRDDLLKLLESRENCSKIGVLSRKPVYISRKKQKTETKKVTYYGEAIQKTSSNGLTNCPLGGLLKRTTVSQPETGGTRKADWSLPAWNRDLGLKTLIENPGLSADRETSTQGRELLQGRKFLLTPTGLSGMCESKYFSCNLSRYIF